MTSPELEVLNAANPTSNDEEYNIPLNISDIITVCVEFNRLGLQIQNQMENLLELGVEESIKSGQVKPESLPHIKHFLQQIASNAYLGEAASSAQDCIRLIKQYETWHQSVSPLN